MNLRKLLRRYWFEFEPVNPAALPVGLTFGCGITAFDYDDAISILKQKVFKGKEISEFKTTADIDIRTLDQGHVAPNIRDPTLRGVWFPSAYD